MAVLSLLQLDTGFPRIAGDVGCRETFRADLDVHVIDALSVARVVTPDPHPADLDRLGAVLAGARGDVITTSCGFLSVWQDRLAALAPAPFVSSALCALPSILRRYAASELAILTFDAGTLLAPAFAPSLHGFGGPVVGLADGSHLKQVIADDLPTLDAARAEAEIIALVAALVARERPRALLLECTNLPPYKAALAARFDLEIFDILTLIHSVNPDIVDPAFL